MSDTAHFSRVEITHYGQHRLHAHYSGVVDRAGALALARIIDLAFGYYRYPTLELAIESPGGALEALALMASTVQRWQVQGHAVEVRSTFECASAAALLLASGTWGHRSVSPGTALVFHFPRVMVSGAVIKSAAAAHISRRLRRCDEQTLSWLCATVASAAGGAQALACHMAQRTAALRWRWDAVAQALAHPLAGPEIGPASGPQLLKPVQRVLAAQGFEATYRRAVGDMMALDAPIDLRLAYALCLVDRVEGVLGDGREERPETPSAGLWRPQAARAPQV